MIPVKNLNWIKYQHYTPLNMHMIYHVICTIWVFLKTISSNNIQIWYV